MARLPEAEALGERPVPTLPRRTPMVAQYRPTSGFEEAGSQQAAHSSQEEERAAHIVLQVKEQQDNLRAEDAATQLRAKQIDMTYGKDGFATLKGGNAVNRPLLKEYGGAFDQAAANIGGTLDNDYQRQIFNRRAQISGLQMREDITRHVAHQSDVYADTVFKSKMDVESKMAAARWMTPDAAAVPLLNIDNAIQNQADRLGMTGDEGKVWVDDQKQKARSVVYSNMVKQALFSDPSTGPFNAQAIYRRYYTEIDPGTRAVLQHEIGMAVRPIEAKRDAESVIRGNVLPDVAKVIQIGGEPLISRIVAVESGGNPAAVSPKGARGLMQLMPDTARGVADRLGLPYDEARLTSDPEYNKALGTQYFREMLTRYSGNEQMALAAYNAGPGMVDDWVNGTNSTGKNPKRLTLGDPNAGDISAADWAQKIPFKETREYVAKIQGGGTGQSAQPQTKAKTQANLGEWIAAAEKQAEATHPGDILYRDAVVQNVKGYVGTVVAAQEGVQKGYYQQLIGALNPQKGERPTTMDQLMATPENRQAYFALDPQQQSGIIGHLHHNLQQSLGAPIKADGNVVMDLLNKIHLPPEDPNRIRNIGQLLPYFGPGKGINQEAYNFLSQQIDKSQSVTGGKFSTDVNRVGQTARSMLTKSIIGSVRGDLAEEAAYHFARDLDAKVDEYQKAGKDVRTLFTPGSPDYVLMPSKVMSYLNVTPQDAVGSVASATPVEPTAINPKTGAKMVYRSGRWQQP